MFGAQAVLSFFLTIPSYATSFQLPGSMFKFGLMLDGLSILMLLCIGIVASLTLVVAASVHKDQRRKFNFINLLLFAVSGMNAVVLVADIFSLYVFIEITAVASYVLISFEKDLRAMSATFKYIVLSIVASVFMLLSIAILLLITGSTHFMAIHQALPRSEHTFLAMLAVGLFISGLSVKAGLVPFHAWLPDVYSHSSAAVSLFLAGIVSKILGVYALIRVVSFVFMPDASVDMVILSIGLLSIFIAALAALAQSDLKRMLAYSSISQVGYIMLGLGCATPLGMAAAAFHFFNHTIFKSLLFVNAAALELETGTTDMHRMGGLSKTMPVTGFTSVLASLSAAGVPPLAGFWSKLLIVIALWQTGHFAIAFAAILASVLTLSYLLAMQRMVFFGKLRQDLAHTHEAGFGLVLASIVLAFIVVAAGLFFPFILDVFILPVRFFVGG